MSNTDSLKVYQTMVRWRLWPENPNFYCTLTPHEYLFIFPSFIFPRKSLHFSSMLYFFLFLLPASTAMSVFEGVCPSLQGPLQDGQRIPASQNRYRSAWGQKVSWILGMGERFCYAPAGPVSSGKHLLCMSQGHDVLILADVWNVCLFRCLI